MAVQPLSDHHLPSRNRGALPESGRAVPPFFAKVSFSPSSASRFHFVMMEAPREDRPGQRISLEFLSRDHQQHHDHRMAEEHRNGEVNRVPMPRLAA